MSWEKAKLGEMCTIEKGNIGILKAIPGEYPLVVLGEERKSHNEYQFDDEAVIIPLVSSTGHGHRSMKRIFLQKGKFSVGSILCAVIPNDKSKLSAEFLYRYLDFNKEKELVSRMRGMANVSLPIKEIADVDIPLPPIEHQKKLIEEFQKLETANNQITAELSHQLELVRQLRQAFLREAMQGKLIEQDYTDEPAASLLKRIKAEKEKLVAEKKIKKEKPLPEIKAEEIPFEIPSNWTWCRFQDITTVITCGMASTPKYYSEGRIFLSAKNVKPFRFMPYDFKFVDEETYRKVTQNAKPELNDILITRVGAGIGETALIDKEIDFAYYVSLTLVKPLKNYINPKFLVFWLNSPKGIHSAITYTTGTGSSQGNLNVEKVRGFLIPIPPLAEQKLIVEKLEKLMAFCDELEAKIRESKTQAETLLQVALKEALEPK